MTAPMGLAAALGRSSLVFVFTRLPLFSFVAPFLVGELFAVYVDILEEVFGGLPPFIWGRIELLNGLGKIDFDGLSEELTGGSIC
jgi:hypothetical protein